MLVWNVHALEWLHSEMSFKCLNAAETGCINEYLRQLCCAIWVVADRWRFKEGKGLEMEKGWPSSELLKNLYLTLGVWEKLNYYFQLLPLSQGEKHSSVLQLGHCIRGCLNIKR